MQKRVVVTGGTGLIGAALSKELVGQGYHVIATGTHHQSERSNDNITLVTWDGADSITLVPYLEGADAVVHLAGSPVQQRWNSGGRASIRDTRVRSGEALIASLRKCKKRPRTLIQASAIGIYADCGGETINEQRAAAQTWLAQVCSEWEASTAKAKSLGIRRCIIRSAPVLANGGFLAQRSKPFRYYLGGPVLPSTQWQSWISLEDEVLAILFLLKNKKCSGAYNLSSPGAAREREFAQALGASLHRPSWLAVPQWLLKLRYGTDMTKQLLACSCRAYPQRLVDSGFMFRYPDLSEALRTIESNSATIHGFAVKTLSGSSK